MPSIIKKEKVKMKQNTENKKRKKKNDRINIRWFDWCREKVKMKRKMMN